MDVQQVESELLKVIADRLMPKYTIDKLIAVKAPVAEGSQISTVENVWKAANWMEREVYDLFGIDFEGHSNMKRILLWDGYDGHPLRKDFPLTGKPQAMTYR